VIPELPGLTVFSFKTRSFQYKETVLFHDVMVSACFHPNTNIISINKEWLKIASDEEVVRVIAHELRHMFQFNMVLYSDDIKHNFDQETIDTWKREFQNYQLPVANKELFEKYSKQQIEIDAENYANEFVEALKMMKEVHN
jgi:hypothetical protein